MISEYGWGWHGKVMFCIRLRGMFFRKAMWLLPVEYMNGPCGGVAHREMCFSNGASVSPILQAVRCFVL